MPDAIKKALTIWQNKNLNNADYILLLPHDDMEFNDRVRTSFIAKLNNRTGIVIEGPEARMLLTLYSLYAFTDKIIIGSFSEPHGRKLFNLLTSRIAAQEELINDVILGAM